ncbi:Metalloenzyme, LuxS/M16 peptidase-like protein [Multifurca ochricompacta]|uniref:Metalloenzyme, LuxS/M16 peptidase-like protein n=1 Tax=Multifurca ochricompacta TaxID=376703 RepID=A0AAD4MAC9_9AGAM|nr:Metalloenzyme, LuxS/M16 peptidase-like protein [Multifurca ochricompacta]
MATDLGSLQDAQHWHHLTPPNAAPYWLYTRPIQKSQQDDREYRLIRLDNGLQAMLVHDAKADKAAASLDVAVGHLHDPDDMPGLAHFCEHLLFMGTEQFPKENEYSEFLSRNNGSSNAFTASTNTNYYFNVATTALAGALERFSGFFHSPLFAPSGTVRELNAVDSEHKKNHQNDIWRIYQVNKHLTKPGHVWSKFGSGNKGSLTSAARELMQDDSKKKGVNISRDKETFPVYSSLPSPSSVSSASTLESSDDGGVVGRETRRRLVEWWSKEYCASRMRLCVIGKDPLDHLSDLVVSLFSPIPNRGQIPLPSIPDHPFGPDEKGTLVYIQTIMDFHAMEISFPIDEQTTHWQFKPGSYLANIIGHEGAGSLHSYLKERGWITTLSTGVQDLARGFATFKITLHLSQNGFQNYRQVAMATFKYISMLRSTDLSPPHQKEVSTLSNIRFRFSEKRRPDDYAVWVADKLSWPVPRELVIKAPQVVSEWDPDGTAQAVAFHTLGGLSVRNSRIVLMGKKEEFERIMGIQQWQTEPWYGTQYRVERQDDDFVRESEGLNTIDAFRLPLPNEFIPKRLDVDKREVTQPQPRPHLVYQSPRTTLWHKKDDQFWVPKARVIIEMRTPVANASPIASVLTKLYAVLVTDALNEYSYDADLAGLTYSFEASSLGFYVSVSGYNDKLHVLLRDVLGKAKCLEVRVDRLEVMKEKIKRDWENFFLGQSYQLSDYYGRYLMNEKQWTILEKLQVLGSVTSAQVQQHIEALLSQLETRMLVVGNMYKDEAIYFAKMTEEIIPAGPIPDIGPVDLSLQLPEGSDHVWSSPVPNPNEPNSALTYYVHYGSKVDRRLRVTAALLTQILSEPAFDILRTKEQLGYIVGASTWTTPGDNETGLRIVVQSERGPVYLEERVEAFLDHMKGVIENMTDEQFVEQKNGLERKWREVVKNLNEEVSRFWAQIDSGYLDFMRHIEDAEFLEAVSKHDVLSLFLTRVHPFSKTRSKLSIHAHAQKPRPKHVSRAAADAFAHLIHEHGIQFGDADWNSSLYADGEPTDVQFIAFWKSVFAEAPVKTSGKIFASLSDLMDRFPADKDAQGSLKEGVVHINEILAFRKSLKVSEHPRPLVVWNDLPASRF